MNKNPFYELNLPSAQLTRIREEVSANMTDDDIDLGESVDSRVLEAMIPIMKAFEEAAVTAKAEADTNEFMLVRVRGIVESGYAGMGYTDMDHHQFSGMVRMLDRRDLDHESVVQAARDRIVYLADQVADLTDVINEIHGTGVRVLKDTTFEQRSYIAANGEGRWANICKICDRAFSGPWGIQTCAHCTNHSRDLYNEKHDISTMEIMSRPTDPVLASPAAQYILSHGLVKRYRAMLLQDELTKSARELAIQLRLQPDLHAASLKLPGSPLSGGFGRRLSDLDYSEVVTYEPETTKPKRVGPSPAQKLLERKRAARLANKK